MSYPRQKQRRHKLETLKRLYSRREQSAAREFALAHQIFGQEREQLDGLKKLLGDYSSDYEAQKKSGTQAIALKRWQKFVDNLQSVATQQARRVQQVHLQQQKKQQVWLNTQRDLRGIERLREKLTREAVQEEHRTEQQLLDEMGHRKRP